ncbi:cation:proton antiporter [Millisia brevis]|uniref:cation:proton antiporter n=1 Tax=Millisia brevis TaxID=264148 RepID=UPI00082C3628|nr:sodium:proton antiporter [Millisia brevis]
MNYLLIGLAALTVVIVCTAVSRRTGIATPLLLLVLGIVASYLPAVPDVAIEPEFILAGVLPLLLYSSAVRLPVTDFRRNFGMITWLSVLLVVLSALGVGLAIHLIFPAIPLSLAVAFGAVVSPTDAVAATSIGKRLGLPGRLMSILEGESLVNDASALVTLRTALAALAGSFSFWQALGEFGRAVLVAVVVGALVGFLTSLVRGRVDDPVLNTVISFFVPFVAYLPAEELRGSGVLAVVVAGLIAGHHATRRLSAEARAFDASNWATISFVLESSLFLILGLELTGLVARAQAEGGLGQVVAIAAITLVLLVVLRALGVGVAVLFRNRSGFLRRTEQRIEATEQWLSGAAPETERQRSRTESIRRSVDRHRADVAFERSEPIGRKGALVLTWAGMRGVVTLAAAQTIPVGTQLRDTLILAAFGVAVATLLGFGSSLPALIRRLDFPDVSAQDSREEFGALLRSLGDSAVEQLGPLDDQIVDGRPLDPAVADRMRSMVDAFRERRVVANNSEGAADQMAEIYRRYIAALREALVEERSIGAYRSETYAKAQRMLDALETRGGMSGLT